MPDTTECTEILSRYLKARVPFISVRTDERGRAIAILRELAGQIKLPFYLHTLSQGVRDITTGRTVYDERSLPAALEFSTQQVHQRQQLTFVFTDVNGLEDETDIARQFYDLVMLAADNNCSLVVLTSKPVWSSLQRLGMTVTLDRPTEDEMFPSCRIWWMGIVDTSPSNGSLRTFARPPRSWPGSHSSRPRT